MRRNSTWTCHINQVFILNIFWSICQFMRFQTTPPALPADGAEARAFAEAGGTVVDVRAGVIAAGD